jgi:dipeptidyl aminopeptidase/acylaminoacyl peptidase
MIRSVLIVIALSAVAFGESEAAQSATNANDGALLETRTYNFPTFDNAEGIDFYASRSEYEAAVADKQFEFKKIRYSSDGLSVTAYLYTPAQTQGKTFPVIIFNRGSGPAGDSAPLLISMFHRLAASGFVILAPQYRGSDGGEGRDEIGGADLDDVKNIILLARSIGYIDITNVFMYGESRGGMMTYQAIRDGVPIKAAAVFGAFTDLEIMNKSPYVQKMIPNIWPDYELHQDEIIRRRSAKYWPDKLAVPLLIMNGGADQQVDPRQPLQLAEQLQSLGKTYELIIYAEDNHFVEHHRNDRDQHAIAWFRSHLVR